jgi:hypothetical protein
MGCCSPTSTIRPRDARSRGGAREPRCAWVCVALATVALAHGCNPRHEFPHALGAFSQPLPAAQDPGEFEVPPPPFSEGAFPCSDCHDPEIEVNTRRRELSMAHQEIVLRHDEEHRWCLDCHSAGSRDQLHLSSGELIEFSESYRLCGQCHGDKYRDWRAGVHGRRTGEWNGHKSYLLCVHCHDAHSPRFEPIEPMPPPMRPGDLRR